MNWQKVSKIKGFQPRNPLFSLTNIAILGITIHVERTNCLGWASPRKSEICGEALNILRRNFLMNKTELVAAIAEKTELSKKDAEAALKAFTDVVADELKKGEKIQLVGFGTFEVSERPAREGRNPRTGETMTIAASKAPKFKAGKALKDSIN